MARSVSEICSRTTASMARRLSVTIAPPGQFRVFPGSALSSPKSRRWRDFRAHLSVRLYRLVMGGPTGGGPATDAGSLSQLVARARRPIRLSMIRNRQDGRSDRRHR